MPKHEETSESGSPIYRYDSLEREGADFHLPEADEESIAAIEEHIKTYVGDGDGQGMVFHELISDIVHIDVHMIPPTKAHNYHTLITTGMSDRPMAIPPQAGDVHYAELLMCLPPTWDLSEDAFSEERNYWPIRWLKKLARFPHEYNTWLGSGHTVPNGDPPQPFADNTRLCGIILASPVLFDDGICRLQVRSDKAVNFYSLIPIYAQEMSYKLRYGAHALFVRLERRGINELLDVKRRNVCEKKLRLPGRENLN